MPMPPVTLTFDLLTLKVVSETRVMWATSVSILVFLGLSVLELGPMYCTRQTSDRQTDVRQHHRLTMLRYGGGSAIVIVISVCCCRNGAHIERRSDSVRDKSHRQIKATPPRHATAAS